MSASLAGPRPDNRRWIQLLLGVASMVLIANLQYGWTLFVQPLQAAHADWAIADIQLAFAIFVALETWLTPAGGWMVERLGAKTGPKVTIALGGVLVGIGWGLNSIADTLTMLYVGSAITGIGGGFIYATCVGLAVKWFPDRRGLAVGVIAAGFGAGAALTIIPIEQTIKSSGYAHTFLVFGLGQGVLLFLLAWFMRYPAPGEAPAVPSRKVAQSVRNYSSREMLATPVFWLLYLMFVMVSASGLMATAQLSLIAKDFGLDKMLLLGGSTVLATALIVDSLANGAARPFFGWVSDQIGRETTMAIAFTLGGIAYLLLGQFGSNPWMFVLFAALIFFTWGEIFSLFPSTCTDAFGAKYATTNSAFLYTAKGASALLVPFANMIKQATGSWWSVFLVAAAMNFVVVFLALVVLKPMRRAQERRLASAVAV